MYLKTKRIRKTAAAITAALLLCSCANGSDAPPADSESAASVTSYAQQAAAESTETSAPGTETPAGTTAVSSSSETKSSDSSEAPETTASAAVTHVPETNVTSAAETAPPPEKPARTVTEIDLSQLSDGEKLTLEKAMDYTVFSGDYSFDKFLENGGAQTEPGVVRFLVTNLLENSYDLPIKIKFGCSAFTAKGTDRSYFGRNFDWYSSGAMVVLARPDNGYSSLSTANTYFLGIGGLLDDKSLAIASIYCPLDGMNEKGLCVSVNMITGDETETDQDNGRPDLTTTTAVRLLLDKAHDVDSAIELLGQYDMHFINSLTVHFLISDRSGRSVCVEYIDNRMVVTETPVMTNHYISPEGKMQIKEKSSSPKRFGILTKALEENNGSFTKETVMDALESVSQHNFEQDVPEETTEWSVVYDTKSGEALYCHREDYTKAYLFRLPMS